MLIGMLQVVVFDGTQAHRSQVKERDCFWALHRKDPAHLQNLLPKSCPSINIMSN